MAASADLIRTMGALSVQDKVSELAHVLVDTPEELVNALDVIGDEKVLAVDCKGVNLGRYCFDATTCVPAVDSIVSRMPRILLAVSRPDKLQYFDLIKPYCFCFQHPLIFCV